MNHAPAYPHDPLLPLADDVFLVRGSLLLNPLIRISRNMVVLRQRGELWLVNPVRLNDTGMAALQRLGAVRHLVCLGALHGLDDAWYRRHFQVQTWARPGSRRYPAPADARPLDAAQGLPVAGAQVFNFMLATQPESALLLPGVGAAGEANGQGLLLTCDALQHYGDYHQHSPLARLVMPFIGFPKTTLVGPMWRREVTPPGGSLKPDFDRLLQWRFDRLVAAHGSVLTQGAHAAVAAAVQQAFGNDG